MITISDQILLSNLLPLDTRLSNVKVQENNIVVETIPYYLNRVDPGSRYLGMEVFILSPFGTYSISDFLNYTSNGSIVGTKYRFSNISDEGFVAIESSNGNIAIINDLVTGGEFAALSADQGKVLKLLIDNHKVDYNNPHKVDKSQIGLGNVPNLTFGGSNTGDETKQSLLDKLGKASSINSGYLSSEDYVNFSQTVNIEYGARYTGSNSGYVGELWVDDDYLYICVVPGESGIAKWKKITLLSN